MRIISNPLIISNPPLPPDQSELGLRYRLHPGTTPLRHLVTKLGPYSSAYGVRLTSHDERAPHPHWCVCKIDLVRSDRRLFTDGVVPQSIFSIFF